MKRYINYRPAFSREVETIDECESKKEAALLCADYNEAFGGGCYISSRCTKDWRENH